MKSPRLKPFEMRLAKSNAEHVPIDFRLRLKGRRRGVAIGIHRDTHVHLGDVQVQSEVVEAFEIRPQAGVVDARDMHLESDPIQRHAAVHEILRHRVNRIGLRVVLLGTVVIVKKQGVRIRRRRADEALLNVAGAKARIADAGRVIPNVTGAQGSIVIERLVDDVPDESITAVMRPDLIDVIIQNRLQLRGREAATC